MEALASIFDWLREQEAGFSAVAAILVIGGVVFAGVRMLLQRGTGEALKKALARLRGRTILVAAGAGALLVLAGVAAWLLLADEPATGTASRVGPESPMGTDSAGLGDDEFTVPGFSGVPAIVVLAFDNLSGDPDQEYFADGISEDLITQLSRWRRFPVIARNSSFTYKGKAVDVQQVGLDLGARYVVEGSVRKAGDRVRVTAQLIDAKTGHHVWADSYDRELSDIFAVQDEIVEAIVVSIRPEVRKSERERAARQRPQNLGAYDLAMRGWWHYWRMSQEDNRKARSFFERAIELDPLYANAWSGLAATHALDYDFDWIDSPAVSLSKLERAVQSCIEADSQYAGCYRLLSRVHELRGDSTARIAALERLVTLDPSSGWGQGWMGYALSLSGRPEEAIAHLERALRLDPMGPETPWFLAAISWAHFDAERYEAAVDAANRSLRIRPDFELGYRTLAASYAQLGQMEKAQAAVAEQLRIWPTLTISKIRQQNLATEPEFLERWLEGLLKAGLPE